MKKIFLILLVLFVASPLFSQDTLFDDIHVNNHATIVGNITNNGSTFVQGGILVDPSLNTTRGAQIHAIFTNQVDGGVVYLGDVYGATNTPQFVGRRARGTQAVPTAIQSGDSLSQFKGRGYGSTGFSLDSRGGFSIHADENWTDANQGTFLRFQVTSNLTTTTYQAMRLNNLGNLGIATSSPTEKLHVVGNALITGNITVGGASTFNGASTNNSTTVNNGTSTFNSGIFYNLKTTGTNYTDSTSDFIVQYRGTTAAAVTNFLPAISTTVTNGFTLVIKDGQLSSSVTNIVIFPNGTDTIGNSTNKILNSNGASVNVTVDGPNKNWFIW